MCDFSFKERRLMISYSSKKNNALIPKKIFIHRVNLIKALKTYIKKYYYFASNKNNILYLSILYLDIILSKDKINLAYEKNLKYLCLCCFILSLKFLGDYDLSKKIIRNFCQNYKNEYNIFEIQCIQLLDYNLLYTTTYDYLNIILNQDQQQLTMICNSFLYKICEDDSYLHYSPFYISMAIIHLGKNYLNDKSYNHYDKYFHDQRVIYLYKVFNQRLNIKNPSIKLTLDSDDLNDKILFQKQNYINYYKNQTNNNISNINIFTNNTIQNNIVIINEINKENIDINANDIDYRKKTNLKTTYSNGNLNPSKIIVRRFNTHKINCKKEDDYNKIYNYNNNYNNTFRIQRIRQNQSKNEKNLRCRNSFNTNNFNFNINSTINQDENEKTPSRIKNNGSIKNTNKNSNIITNKQIYSNKSSLNFKLLSNVPRELLFKLSKNISKTFGSSLEKIKVNKLNNFK